MAISVQKHGFFEKGCTEQSPTKKWCCIAAEPLPSINPIMSNEVNLLLPTHSFIRLKGE